MAEIVKVLASEISLSTANTVGLASCVRVFNNNAGLVLITRKADSTTLGTITLAAGEIIYIQKAPADTLTSNTAVLAVSVAFN